MPSKTSKSAGSKSATKSKSSTKTTKSKSSTKKTSSSKSEPVVAAPEPVVAAPESVVAAPESVVAAPESTSESTSDSIELEFLSLATRLQDLKTMQMAVVSDLKKLHKTVQKHMKDSNKKRRNKKLADPNRPKRAPSGFAKPTVISTELCNFLGKPEGTEMARTEVTKFLTQYISEHKLKDQKNRRKILPDKPLQKLLNANSTDEVTYFNLQKYMKVHFPKSKVSSA